MTTVLLPWPSSTLSPNSRKHWAAKARATKEARNEAAWRTIEARVPKPSPDARLNLTLTFHAPDGRRRDTDNLLSSMKPSLDGIADILGVDDSKFNYTLHRAEMVKGGMVRIEITEAA